MRSLESLLTNKSLKLVHAVQDSKLSTVWGIGAPSQDPEDGV